MYVRLGLLQYNFSVLKRLALHAVNVLEISALLNVKKPGRKHVIRLK